MNIHFVLSHFVDVPLTVMVSVDPRLPLSLRLQTKTVSRMKNHTPCLLFVIGLVSGARTVYCFQTLSCMLQNPVDSSRYTSLFINMSLTFLGFIILNTPLTTSLKSSLNPSSYVYTDDCSSYLMCGLLFDPYWSWTPCDWGREDLLGRLPSHV